MNKIVLITLLVFFVNPLFSFGQETKGIDKNLENLIEVGEDCKRCGWKKTNVLWCSETHEITVGALLSLKKYRERRTK